MNDVIRVGIGVFIVRNGGSEVLLGRRRGAHGEGEWAFPGGKQDFGETLFHGAAREVFEECGPNLKIDSMDILCIGDLMAYSPKQFTDIGVVANWVSGEPEIMEPDKCSEWRWFAINDLPDNLFASVTNYVDAWNGGDRYWVA